MIDLSKLTSGADLRKAANELKNKALICEQDYDEIISSLDEYLFDANREQHKAVKITCAGIYNSGKSSVLNVLTGGEHFKVGDIPTTATIDEFEYNGRIYVDTPGLNANNFDNETARKAFKDADVILFISNMRSGGLNAAEADYLKQLSDILGGIENLKNQVIFAMSNMHQVSEDSVKTITLEHAKNIETALGFMPEKVLIYDAVTYESGVNSENNELIDSSGVVALKDEITTVAKQVSEKSDAIRKERIAAKETALEKAISKAASKLEFKISKLTEQAKATSVNKDDVESAIERCKTIIEKAKMNIEIPNIENVAKDFLISSYDLYGSSTYISRETSKHSITKKAKEKLQRAYDHRESALRQAAGKVYDYLSEKVGDNAFGSKIKEISNNAIMLCNNNLKDVGVILSESSIKQIDAQAPIKVIDRSTIMSEVQDDVISYDSCYSLNNYFDVYCDIDSFERYDHSTRFGRMVYKTEYSCDCREAIDEMAKDMNNNLRGGIKFGNTFLMTGNISRVIANAFDGFEPFCSTVKSELDNRLQSMISEAKSAIKNANSNINAEIRDLRSYLESINKYLV